MKPAYGPSYTLPPILPLLTAALIAASSPPLVDAAINARLEFAPPVSMGEGTAWMSGFVRMGPPSGARTVFTGSLGKGGWRTSRDGGYTWKADPRVAGGGSFFPSVLSGDQLRRTNFGNISAYNASLLYTHFEGAAAQELRLDPASGNLTVSTLPNQISFRGIPPPGVRPLRLGGADSLRLQDGTWLLSAMTWTPPPGPGNCTGTNCTEYSLYAFKSRDGFAWDYAGVIASATAVPYAEEGPSEDGLAQLANGDIVCVFRVDGGDGLHHRHLPYVLARSTDNGATWSEPLTLPKGVGSARPKLKALSTGGLLLGGGRTGNFNHDVLLWLNDGVNLTDWSPYSISYRHNLLCNQSRDFNASNPYGPMIPFDAKVNSSSWPGESSSYNSLLFTSDTEFVITYSQWRHHMGALWRDFAMAVKIVPTSGS